MQTEILNVTGMTCGGCTTKVTRVLKAIPGVDSVNVALSTGKVTVQYDELLASHEKVESAVKAAGYGVNGTDAASRDPSKRACCCS